MDESRRKFLKLAGVGALMFGANPMVNAVAAPGQGDVPQEHPLTAKRWAIVIDVKKMQANPGLAEKCAAVCHKVHNVPKFDNPKDEVKWIWQEKFEHAFPSLEQEVAYEKFHEKDFLVFCNHCDNPPCVRVCPTKATWKREDGIVMMDMHRCIGCRYCVVACPYGSRSFNWRDPRPHIEKPFSSFPTRQRGVVEKCNFCAERLAMGQIPACVELCKNDEMMFGDLEDPNSKVREVLAKRFSIRRKPHLGTSPHIFYLV